MQAGSFVSGWWTGQGAEWRSRNWTPVALLLHNATFLALGTTNSQRLRLVTAGAVLSVHPSQTVASRNGGRDAARHGGTQSSGLGEQASAWRWG